MCGRRWSCQSSAFSSCASPGIGRFFRVAKSQSADFVHPQQKGPFQINGLGYGELGVAGQQSGYIDPLNPGSGYMVPTLDEIIGEMKAAGANLAKISIGIGQVKNYNDNALIRRSVPLGRYSREYSNFWPEADLAENRLPLDAFLGRREHPPCDPPAAPRTVQAWASSRLKRKSCCASLVPSIVMSRIPN